MTDKAIEFVTEHEPRQTVEVDAAGEHVSVLIYTKSEGGGCAYLTPDEAIRLRDAIDAKLAQITARSTQEIDAELAELDAELAQVAAEPAQDLAAVAEFVVHEHGEWDEARWKTYSDENVGIFVFFATTSEPPADCVVEIGWKEGARKRVSGPFSPLVVVNEDDETQVLVWRDGVVDVYDEKLGPVVCKYLREKLMPGTPLMRLLGPQT